LLLYNLGVKKNLRPLVSLEFSQNLFLFKLIH